MIPRIPLVVRRPVLILGLLPLSMVVWLVVLIIQLSWVLVLLEVVLLRAVALVVWLGSQRVLLLLLPPALFPPVVH
jgi:hypothetical protein